MIDEDNEDKHIDEMEAELRRRAVAGDKLAKLFLSKADSDA